MNRSLGFTLIELSVVISIMAVLSTMGIAAFVNYSRTQSLQNAAYDLITVLNLAKSRSFSQVKPPGCTVLDGYKVSLSNSDNSYKIEAICLGNAFGTVSKDLPQNISISSDSSCTSSSSFFYPIISGGVSGSGCIVLSGYNQKKIITVDMLGTVK